jgi:hypothetical protein
VCGLETGGGIGLVGGICVWEGRGTSATMLFCGTERCIEDITGEMIFWSLYTEGCMGLNKVGGLPKRKSIKQLQNIGKKSPRTHRTPVRQSNHPDITYDRPLPLRRVP